MKRILGLLVLVLIPLTTSAVEGSQVMYVGGTAATLKEGVLGTLDTTSQSALNFDYSGVKLVIPFNTIDSYEHSQRVARHLGVLPAIAAGLVRHRQRRHFFRFSYHDENKAAEVAIFEVSKETPHTLLAILQMRAPQAYASQTNASHGIQPN
jgi:hypothetical protein